MIRNVATNVSRGFGFVTFDSEEVAEKCVRENNYKIKGKRVDIKRADPRQARPKQSRVYPLGSGGDSDEAPGMYYPPPNWPDAYPSNYQEGKPFNETGVSPAYPWPFMPSMNYPYDDNSRHNEENSSKEDKAKQDIGPIKDYKTKSKTYAPY